MGGSQREFILCRGYLLVWRFPLCYKCVPYTRPFPSLNPPRDPRFIFLVIWCRCSSFLHRKNLQVASSTIHLVKNHVADILCSSSLLSIIPTCCIQHILDTAIQLSPMRLHSRRRKFASLPLLDTYTPASDSRTTTRDLMLDYIRRWLRYTWCIKHLLRFCTSAYRTTSSCPSPAWTLCLSCSSAVVVVFLPPACAWLDVLDPASLERQAR